MNEAEWLSCNNPKAMLGFLAGSARVSDRKYRLFACACCRRVWHLLDSEYARPAVEVMERFADGLATDEERETALASASRAGWFKTGAVRWAAVAFARTAAAMMIDVAGQTAACPSGQDYDPARWQEEWHAQSDLLRDLLGPLPFRPLSTDLSWRTPEVLAIAQANYDQRAFTGMLEIGQALYRAGCRDRDILQHCLWGGEHVRGCWAVDLILAKS